MQKRKPGKDGLEVPALGLGCMGMSFTCGTTRPERLAENPGAASIELSSDDLQAIDTAASKIRIHGARYSEGAAKLIGR